MQKLKPVMIVGTASDVGKSIINTGLCRIFMQDGYHPAPFKSQNMSLNSYATPDGFEIGRAQAVQAEACGIACSTDMNPVLLKPTSDRSSQVILNGKPIGNQDAYTYFMKDGKDGLFSEAKAAFHRLSAKYNPVVMEGAGSISELNLKHRDITNMRMAAYAGADTYLVADIDKGGVFGSTYGTIALLTPDERKLIKGIIINKFRGDASLFTEGKKMLEELCQIPIVGVVPFIKNIQIEEEDSVSLKDKNATYKDGKVNVVVILLSRISNFTDFKALENDTRVHLYYSNDPEAIEKAHVVIIPGSKNTIGDLIDIKNNGVAAAILNSYKNKKTVIGICGGYQMMGTVVEDPFHVEGEIDATAGLGILPVITTLTTEKATEQQKFYFKSSPVLCEGYEIHMGVTKATSPVGNLNTYANGEKEGVLINENVWGTYIHGILDNMNVVDDILKPYTNNASGGFNYRSFKEEQYNKLVDHLRLHLDMEYIYRNMKMEQHA